MSDNIHDSSYLDDFNNEDDLILHRIEDNFDEFIDMYDIVRLKQSIEGNENDITLHRHGF